MKTTLCTLLLLSSQLALGDEIKYALLDLTCTANGKPTLSIKSDATGSSLRFAGAVVDQSNVQLTGGTEGSPPYLQYVPTGFNVTVQGLDFKTAFDENKSFLNGATRAEVWRRGHGSYSATCTGVIGFDEFDFSE